MCDECRENKRRLKEYGQKDIVEVGTTPIGYTIFRVPSREIEGYDYISDSIGGGWCPVNAYCSLEELELIVADMRLVRDTEGK